MITKHSIPLRTIVFCCRLLFAFFAMVAPAALFAQDDATALIQKLAFTKGTAKVDLLNEISVVYRNSDRLKALDFAHQAYQSSVAANYLPGQALARKNEGICWFFIGSNDSAILCYKQALGIYTKLKDLRGISACNNNIGLIAQETGKYEEALKFYQRSIDIDRELKDAIGMAQTQENMADIYIYRGDIRKAMTLTNDCLRIYTEQSYKPGIMASYVNRGSEYNYLKLFQESKRDFESALKLAVELKDKYYEKMVNSNLGVMYWHWAKPEIAMQYLTTTLEMSDESDDAYNIDNTLKTMAEIYTSQKEYVKANDIFQKILNRNIELENQRQVAVIMTAIGRNLLELNEIDKAVGYLNKSLEITVGLDTPFELLENYRNLVHANSILHNFKAADSLQDLFANTYAQISKDNSLSRNTKPATKDDIRNNHPNSEPVKWMIAIMLLILIFILSALAFGKKGNDM